MLIQPSPDQIVSGWLDLRTRGVGWLTRLPVTEEIAGSNPVGSASLKPENNSERPRPSNRLPPLRVKPDPNPPADRLRPRIETQTSEDHADNHCQPRLAHSAFALRNKP